MTDYLFGLFTSLVNAMCRVRSCQQKPACLETVIDGKYTHIKVINSYQTPSHLGKAVAL